MRRTLVAAVLLAQTTALRGRRRWRDRGGWLTAAAPLREPDPFKWTFSTKDWIKAAAPLREPPHVKSWTFSTRDLLTKRRPKRVLMLMSDTGGGHRASANALKQALVAKYGRNVQVDLLDIWTAADKFPWSSSPKAYSYMGKRPHLWRAFFYGTAFYPVRLVTRLLHDFSLRRRFKKLLKQADPDLVVSVHPMCQHVPLSARTWLEKNARRPVKFATVVTDLGSAHPMWFDRRVDACFVPTQRLAKLGKYHGVGNVVNYGLPLRKEFSETKPSPRTKERARRKLGLARNSSTVLVTGGGDGFGSLEKIVDAVAQELTGKDAQLVVICGRNEELRRLLQARDWAQEAPGLSVVVRGFVSDMNLYMEASDVLLTKAGPGTIAEAAALGLPVLLTGFLPGQERGNVLWVREKNIGELERSPEKAARTVAAWLNDAEALETMSRNARKAAKPQATDKIAEDLMALVEGVASFSVARVLRDLKAPDALSGALNYSRAVIGELKATLPFAPREAWRGLAAA